MVYLDPSFCGRGHNIHSQSDLLFRSRSKRILPPDSGQLLFRPMDRVAFLGDRGSGFGNDEIAPLVVVRFNDADILFRAQDLRAMDVGGAKAVVEGGEPV